MIDEKMWYDWIRHQMAKISGQKLGQLGSEATLLELSELDTTLLPKDVAMADWPRQVVVYTYNNESLDVLGYVISSIELDVLYLAGVVVDGELRWSQIGGESE